MQTCILPFIRAHPCHPWRPSLDLLQDRFPALPSGVAAFGISASFLGRVFTRAHETVAGAWIGHRLIRFSDLLHKLLRFWYGAVDSGVIFGIEAINGALNLRQVILILSELTVEDKRRLQVLAVGREAERLAAAPAKAAHRDLAIAGRMGD